GGWPLLDLHRRPAGSRRVVSLHERRSSCGCGRASRGTDPLGRRAVLLGTDPRKAPAKRHNFRTLRSRPWRRAVVDVRIDNRMARQPRNEVAGSIYHVTVHAVADTVIVRNDRDRKILIRTLARVARRYHWEVLCVAVLDTHLHALIRTPEKNLGRGMQY